MTKKKESKRTDLIIEDARIMFRNFTGKEERYNSAGQRNFCVALNEDISQQLQKDRWNIRWLPAREEGEPDLPYMKVKVNFDGNPPRVVLISNGKKTLLDEDSVNILDWADIEKVDLSISPYSWEVNGKTGISAYLKSIYVTIAYDELEEKYFDTPASAQSATFDFVND